MPHQPVICFYDEESLSDLRGLINDLCDLDYAEHRKFFKWHAQDQREIWYSDLPDQYLLNILAMLTRKADELFNSKISRTWLHTTKAREAVKLSNYTVRVYIEHALVIIEALYRGLVELPEGITEIIRLRSSIKKIIEISYKYKEPECEPSPEPEPPEKKEDKVSESDIL